MTSCILKSLLRPGLALALAVSLALPATASAADWQPVAGKMMTRWSRAVTPENAWREYPRPQLERADWQILNGLWDYAIAPKDAGQPVAWEGKILVPFAVESALSGVGRMLEPDQSLWYRRTFDYAPQAGRRVLLNFEAVDYHAKVWVNGREVGEHIGGSTPFAFDVTGALKLGANKLVVRVWDATGGAQLRGKQTLKPEGIWYTRVSGIWQTVWLESVAERHVADVKIATAIKPATISVTPQLAGTPVVGETVRVTALLNGKKVASAKGTGELKLKISSAKLWSPASPTLYDLKIELLDSTGKVVDAVRSYAGLREVGRTVDAAGHHRLTLNGKEIFHWGPLDQGWWPDGLLTPPSDAAMRSDVDFLKAAGFNMIRKHIKVEPRRYYAHCDRVGMLLWQDQVSGGPSPKWTRMAPNPNDAEWSDAEHAQWMRELKAMMDSLDNHPSIVVWVPFNEAWGQHRTMEVGKWTSGYDRTRLVNIASGGNFWPAGDIADEHRYPDPGFPLRDERFKDYVKVVGEFGGHGWPVEGHLWNPGMHNWGYGGLPQTKDEYFARYITSLNMLADLKMKGISAGVYTQTTDVEGEINGLLTYDREVIKIPVEKLAEWHRRLGPEVNR
jgi:beta-galactosidase/beta-glucuronidase